MRIQFKWLNNIIQVINFILFINNRLRLEINKFKVKGISKRSQKFRRRLLK